MSAPQNIHVNGGYTLSKLCMVWRKKSDTTYSKEGANSNNLPNVNMKNLKTEEDMSLILTATVFKLENSYSFQNEVEFTSNSIG